VQAHQGAAVVLARDYQDAGRLSGLMAARIMRGENPAKIPFEKVSRTRLIINPAAAEAAGLKLPADFVKTADEVIR
jgi:putative ABC transport system substrate-binding protein